MDKKDLAILRCIDEDIRASSNQIGSKVRLKKETVSYRLSKLIENKTITGFYGIINGSKLGYKYYKMLITYRNVSSQKEIDIFEFLKNDMKNIVWFGTSDGIFNLSITLMAKNLKQFSDFYLDFMKKYGIYFQEKIVLQMTRGSIFNEKYLYAGNFKFSIENDLTEKRVEYDKTDIYIISLISQNSRISYVDISKRLGLSSEAIRKRLSKLSLKGIIKGYKLRLDFSLLDMAYYHFFISLLDINKKKELINYCRLNPNCLGIFEYIGNYDLHLEFVFNSNNQLRAIITDLRDKFGDSISELITLNVYKENSINIFPLTKSSKYNT